ncbi:MAG TPA: DUF4190 domain-containing protein [Arenimonas sp.]|uniref:DUF4190 domain-containing protein n=1 Tax=Arenimonas sp. TaxID=1872635 RepID=UPI002D80B017|nr:DUF4190 domain-containing protein [Arenimonas sp.]HEU0151943.1 DUF4190 domain-containing protein [Arenimonas sp.]
MSEPTTPPAAPPSPPASTPAPAAAPAARPTSPLAIVSLVGGLLGWTLLPLLGSLAAVVFGHLARAEIARSAGGMDGDGLAIAGLVLGWTAILLTVLTVLAFVLFFGGLAVLLGLLGMSGQL